MGENGSAELIAPYLVSFPDQLQAVLAGAAAYGRLPILAESHLPVGS
jgi:hypothetical protein